MIYLYIIIFIIVFILLRERGGISYVIGLDLFVRVFTGGISDEYKILLEPSDWLTLIIMTNIIIYAIENKKSNLIFKVTWFDKLFTLYILLVLLIPGFVNFFFWDVPLTFNYFVPIRIWLVYKNYFALFKMLKLKNENRNISFENIFIRKLLFFAFLSAVLSILRFFPIPYKEVIENTWPVVYNGKIISINHWGRLQGTMSATNGTGNFFAIVSIISLFKLKENRLFKLYFVTFILSVILTGSFSSIGALSIVVLLFLKKNKILNKNILIIFFGLILSVYIILKTDIFLSSVIKRFETGYAGRFQTGIVPSNLAARLSYWQTFINILSSENRLIFGMGPGGFFNYEYGKNNVINQNAESFYFRILNESGIIALCFVIIFFAIILKRARKKLINISQNYYFLFKLILFIYIFAGIANETLYYGINTELFGIFLALFFYKEYY
ncbi:MAG: O-antigen ligase family protein [Promethearchaeota archaeon]